MASSWFLTGTSTRPTLVIDGMAASFVLLPALSVRWSRRRGSDGSRAANSSARSRRGALVLGDGPLEGSGVFGGQAAEGLAAGGPPVDGVVDPPAGRPHGLLVDLVGRAHG